MTRDGDLIPPFTFLFVMVRYFCLFFFFFSCVSEPCLLSSMSVSLEINCIALIAVTFASLIFSTSCSRLRYVIIFLQKKKKSDWIG